MSSQDCLGALGSGVFTGKRASSVPLMVDVSVFGFDLDVYEVKLRELQDVVDGFFVVEMPWTHKGVPKPLLWDRNKDKARFADFKSKVAHIVVDHLPQNLASSEQPVQGTNWGYEGWQEKVGMTHVRDLIPKLMSQFGLDRGQVVMIFGDADEIPFPRNVDLVRHCEPKELPIDNGVWMPMGLFDRAFKTDWPVNPNLPYTFGNPAFHDPFVSSGRTFGGSRRYLLGGWHMTNYAYPPHRMLKQLAATTYPGKFADTDVSMVREGFEKYCRHLIDSSQYSDRFVPISDLEKQEPYKSHPELLHLPTTVANNLERYEAWFGNIDRRLRLDA